jgi:4-amino-4-deoxy-L-arabinose transferase-like glycosyltransferase
MEFSLNAYSIAKTFRDQDGRFLPLYFWHLGGFWSKPVVVYLTAIFLKFLPLTENVIRLPSVFAGLISVSLIMILVQKLFRKTLYTLLAGIMAITTPMLFIHSRVLLDYIFMVLFILLWLVFLKFYIDKRKDLFIFLSGLSLGIGFHTYYGAEIFMPLYLLATLLLFRKDLGIKSSLVFIFGFILPLLPLIPWLLKYPDTLLRKVGYAGAIDPSVDVEKGIWGVLNPSRLSRFFSSYLSYFSPKLLFISGDKSLIHSTQKHGAFLFPLVFPFVFGILNILLKKKDAFSRLLLFGFLTYPIAPALIAEPMRIVRGSSVIPFVILISFYGVFYLLETKEKLLKILLVGILAFSALEFLIFVRGYFTEYPKESYAWFNNDIGGALEGAIKSTSIRNVKNVYIDKNIYFIEKYVKFYSLKLSSDLERRAVYFDPTSIDFSSFPIYSLIVVKAENAPEIIDKVGNFEKIETIREPNGYETFYIFYRGK